MEFVGFFGRGRLPPNPCPWSGHEQISQFAWKKKTTFHLVETNFSFTSFMRLCCSDETSHLNGKSHHGVFLSDTVQLRIGGDSGTRLPRVMPGGKRALGGLGLAIRGVARNGPTSDMTITSPRMPSNRKGARRTIFLGVRNIGRAALNTAMHTIAPQR